MSPEYPIGRSNLDVFSETLQEMAAKDPDVLVLTSDSRGSGKLVPFGERFPDQLIEIGIAEQNLVGVAAGLAAAGKKVFVASPACFLTTRALEQIKNDVAYSDRPVKLIGISAGVSYGALGSTHHSLHDFAALRAVSNLIVMAPADNFETRQSIALAREMDRPVYIRFGKKPMPGIHERDAEFIIGKGIRIRKGNDLAIVATGECVYPSLLASDILEQEYGLKAGVISMHTIRPLDRKMLLEAAAACRGMITVEEHSVHGGLGEACAACLMENGHSLPFRIIGIPDEYTMTGSQAEIFHHYGITGEKLAETALNLIQHK
jgi:transketolase